MPLLEVKNLHTSFYTKDGDIVNAVNGVDFSVEKGETLGIVGESGCGKSVTSLSVMRLIPPRSGRITQGEIWFDGENLLDKTEKEMCMLRGARISMIFQEPMTSLNPSFTIGFQIMEPIRLHQHCTKAQARRTALEMLHLVGMPLPEQQLSRYPHQLSGGMRQRAMIAIALSSKPDLLIADEPTTALDVTIQAQILDLMKEVGKKLNTSTILITHDMGVVADMCDRVAVMYAGRIVEYGRLSEIFKHPCHPYTLGLLASILWLDSETETLHTIPGMVPSLDNMPKGCAFWPRCDHAMPACRERQPDLYEINSEQSARCLLYAPKED